MAVLVVRAVRVVAAGHPQRPGDVAAVAAQRPADVEDDRLAGPDHPVRRLVVRRGRVGPRRDDRELGVVVALREEPLADLARDVRFRPADERPGGDLVDDAVGGLGGEAEERRPRHRPSSSGASGARSWPTRTTRPAARPGGGAGGATRADPRRRRGTARRPRPVRVRRRPPPDPAFRSRSRSGCRPGCRPPPAGRSSSGTTSVARPGRAPDDEHRQPLALVGVVAGEVAEVRPDADEQRVEPGLVRRTSGRGEPCLEPLGGDRRSRRRPSSAGRRDRRAPARTRSSPGRPRTACGTRGPCRRRRRGRACAAPGRRAARRPGPAGRPRPRGGPRRRRRRPGRSGRRSRRRPRAGPGSRRRASGPAPPSAPAARTCSMSRVDQIRSSARTRTRVTGGALAALSRASRRGAGRRPGR